MQKTKVFVSRRLVVFSILIALVSLAAGQAYAAAVFMWVADGSGVEGYDNTGAAVVGLPEPSAGDFADAFSVTTYGTSANNQFVVVSDALNHTLTEYSYNASNNAVAQVGTSFSFPPDPAGGNISPQEIAIDANGNLWTTSAGGAVTEYCGNPSGCSIGATNFSPGQSMQTVNVSSGDGAPRGIMIQGSTIYVTTSSFGALADNVYDFALDGSGAAGSLNGYAALGSSTVTDGQETGQLRGITYDSDGDIFYADSTWAPSGTNDGYINENTGTTAVISGLAGPNQIETGDGTGAGSLDPSCNVLYITNYYGETVQETSTGFDTGGGTGRCGTLNDQTSTFLTLSADISGIALAVGEGGLGDRAGLAEGLFATTPTPEPGTGALLLAALLLIPASGWWRKRSAVISR